jgi:hypothetical protein
MNYDFVDYYFSLSLICVFIGSYVIGIISKQILGMGIIPVIVLTAFLCLCNPIAKYLFLRKESSSITPGFDCL